MKIVLYFVRFAFFVSFSIFFLYDFSLTVIVWAGLSPYQRTLWLISRTQIQFDFTPNMTKKKRKENTERILYSCYFCLHFLFFVLFFYFSLSTYVFHIICCCIFPSFTSYVCCCCCCCCASVHVFVTFVYRLCFSQFSVGGCMNVATR